MTYISDELLLSYNQQGVIPGPNEDEESFLRRAENCLKLKEGIGALLKESLPFNNKELVNEVVPQEILNYIKTIYDISPSWVPIFYSNYQLPFWHGGCAWIFKIKEDSPTMTILQIRKRFKNKKKFLGCYDSNELIAHELVHVSRMAFEEPKFEEMLAYQTTHSNFRRWFGPLIESTMESLFFILTLTLILITDLYFLSFGHYEAFEQAMIIKTIPLGMIVLALSRLCSRHYRFQGCLTNLKKISSKKNAKAFILRLTDKEILTFSKMTSEEIVKYIEGKRENSLRWRVISSMYL